MEIFELQAREIMDCWIIRSGCPFNGGTTEESKPTKLEALQLMDRLLQTEIKNERKNLINGNCDPLPNSKPWTPNHTYNPGGTD